MKLIFDVSDKPKAGQLVVFALQQMLAILAATIAVPLIIGNGLTPAAAMFGAGVGTIVYILFTKRKSPVFLGSSFAFLGSMAAAFAGGVSMQLGMLGLIVGAFLAGLVYVVIAIVVKFVGVGWLNKLMPAVVIGPTVAIIGLSLAGNAIGDLVKGDVTKQVTEYAVSTDSGTPEIIETVSNVPVGSSYVALICGLITLAVVMLCSTYGKKTLRLIPFIIGILAGYAAAAIFTVIGNICDIDALKIVDFSVFSSYMLTDGSVSLKTFVSLPDFAFVSGLKGLKEFDFTYFATIFVAYVPVALVVFAEHVADHKNLSSIIDHDLLEEPGLTRTLLGDGVGSIAGALFGGCPNTTYGESVACVMGGVCIALYGFIAVSGLKMIQDANLDDNRNLFVVSVILIAGIGGLTLTFGDITLTEVAAALILGILTNVMLSKKKGNAAKK